MEKNEDTKTYALEFIFNENFDRGIFSLQDVLPLFKNSEIVLTDPDPKTDQSLRNTISSFLNKYLKKGYVEHLGRNRWRMKRKLPANTSGSRFKNAPFINPKNKSKISTVTQELISYSNKLLAKNDELVKERNECFDERSFMINEIKSLKNQVDLLTKQLSCGNDEKAMRETIEKIKQKV